MSNEKYKISDDSHRRYKEYQVGDYVMVRIKPEQFPSGVVQKLHARIAGPHRILRKIGSNVYVLKLPLDWGISQVFKGEDLVPFQGPTVSPNNPHMSHKSAHLT